MPIQDLAWAVEDVRSRLARYDRYVDYYEGRHSLVFATEKFRNAFGTLFREFADNLCDDVVDEPVSRMKVQGWTASDKGLSQAAQDKWDQQRGGPRAKRVHRNAWREGDAFLIVWQDPKGISRFYPQDPAQMAVRYDDDDPDTIAVAAKVWKAGKRYRANLYYDGVIERYTSKGTAQDGGLPKASAFVPYFREPDPEDPDDQGEPPVETHDWGQPVFHFPADELGQYGRSALADVIPLQDALNKAVSDMLVGMEFHAWPQRWATGIQVERDPVTGKERAPFTGSGAGDRTWWTGSKDARMGEFAAADLSKFLEVQDSLRAEIVRKGCLPPHSLQGKAASTAASGTALLVAEGRLIKRCRDAQEAWGIIWRAAMALALRMDGTDADVEDLDLAWADPATRDEQALVETVTAKIPLGVSKREGLRELGYDDDKIDAMNEEDAKDATEAFTQQQAMAGGRAPIGPAQANALAQHLGIPAAPPAPGQAQPPMAQPGQTPPGQMPPGMNAA